MIDTRIEDLTATLRGLDDAAHIDLIRALEDLKSACAAAQAKITAELDKARDKSVGAEVALARRESPHRGGRHLGFARAMQEMPNTLAMLEAGELNEWRATLLVQETACLTREDRATIDRELCTDAATLAGLGDRAISATARARAAELDPAALVRRARRAVGDRHVSIRPAPDTMTYVTALLPVADGVAVWANLKRDADNLVGTGQAGDRSRGQVMADLLVERVTGTETAAARPVTVNVVISDEALFGDGETPAHVDGYGDTPPPSPATGSCRPATTTLQNSAGSTQTREPERSPASSPLHAASPKGSRGSSTSATGSAAPPGAMPRSDTAITSTRTKTAPRPPRSTAPDYAQPATTPSKPTAGKPNRSSPVSTPTNSPPPAPTPINPPRHRSPGLPENAPRRGASNSTSSGRRDCQAVVPQLDVAGFRELLGHQVA